MTARHDMRAAKRDPFPQLLPAGCDQQGRYITRGETMCSHSTSPGASPPPDLMTLPAIPCSTVARRLKTVEHWLLTARGGLLVCAVSAVAVVAAIAAIWPH